VLAGLPCAQQRGRVVTDEFLQVPDYPGVWAVGDCAAIPDPFNPGKSCPPTAQHAARQGAALAENIVAGMRGNPPQPFRFRILGLLASIGRRTAVAEILGFRFSGIIAWFLWRSIYLGKLPGLQKKVENMKRDFKKRILILFLMLAAARFLSAKTEAVSIKNNVNVSADTGGNIEGSTTTGSASAESSVKNKISGDTSNVSTDVKVEVNGKKKEVQTDKPGDVSIKMQDKNGKVETEITTDASANQKKSANSSKNNQNFFAKTRNFFQSFANWLKNIF